MLLGFQGGGKNYSSKEGKGMKNKTKKERKGGKKGNSELDFGILHDKSPVGAGLSWAWSPLASLLLVNEFVPAPVRWNRAYNWIRTFKVECGGFWLVTLSFCRCTSSLEKSMPPIQAFWIPQIKTKQLTSYRKQKGSNHHDLQRLQILKCQKQNTE